MLQGSLPTSLSKALEGIQWQAKEGDKAWAVAHFLRGCQGLAKDPEVLAVFKLGWDRQLLPA